MRRARTLARRAQPYELQCHRAWTRSRRYADRDDGARPGECLITHAAVATNHQERVEWSSHARFTATVERERFLLQRLTLHVEPEEKFINAFLRPPLYSSAFGDGFGTIYTAVYRARKREMEIRWPRAVWPLALDAFEEGEQLIHVPMAG